MSQPLVLCVIDGFGVSSSWKGNAIASADPKNFYGLWKEYRHELLSPLMTHNLPAYINSGSYLDSLLSGVVQKSDKEIIDDEVATGKLELNAVICDAMEQITKSNSALHLIGNLSGAGGEFGDTNHLLALLKIAEQKNIFKVYVHLILDSSGGTGLDQILPEMENLSRQIENIGVGEIASISGMQSVKDFSNSRLGYINFSKAVRAIIEGRGNVYLSAEQAIAQNKTKIFAPDRMPPSVISYKNRPIGIMHDLDSVIFFNHNNTKLTYLVSSFSGGVGNYRISVPKFLNVTTLLEFSLPKSRAANIAIKKQSGENISSLIMRKKLKQIYISDSTKMIDVKSCLNQNIDHETEPDQYFVPAPYLSDYCSDPNHVITEIFRSTASAISKGYDFIFTDIPSIDLISNEGNFNQTIKAVSIIDQYLPILVKKILEANGKLIITSSYGNAEMLVHRNPFETLNHKTLSPVPFVLISAESKNVAPSAGIENDLLYDIIRKKNNLTSVAPTILALLNLPIPTEMTGKSLV